MSYIWEIAKIVSPFVVGLFDTNISQSPGLLGSPSSQLDFHTPPMYHQIFYASYKSFQKTKSHLELIFLVYYLFDNSSFRCVLVLTFLAWTYELHWNFVKTSQIGFSSSLMEIIFVIEPSLWGKDRVLYDSMMVPRWHQIWWSLSQMWWHSNTTPTNITKCICNPHQHGEVFEIHSYIQKNSHVDA